MMRRLVLMVAMLALVLPGGAQAATVTATYHEVERYKGFVTRYTTVVFDADAGETNAVTAEFETDGEDVIYRDSGAELVPVDRCAAIDAHAVRCTPGPNSRFESLGTIRLGDGDDSFTSPPGGYGPRVDGGSGDDALTIRDPGDGSLFGGDGEDILDGGNELAGGEGNDRLDGRGGFDKLDGGVGVDVLNGGPGIDMVSWGGYLGGLAVDLADPGLDGPVGGDNDALSEIEGVTGGPSADSIRGDAGPNWIDGNGGGDVLYGGDSSDSIKGGAGADWIEGEGGDDAVTGGGGADRVNAGDGKDTVTFHDIFNDDFANFDRVACGAGVDIANHPRRMDLVPRDCERVHIGFESLAPVYDDSHRYVRFDFTPQGGKLREACGVIRLGEPAGRLGLKVFRSRPGLVMRIRVPLTVKGRRVLAPAEPVRIHVRFELYRNCARRRGGEQPRYVAEYRAAF